MAIKTILDASSYEKIKNRLENLQSNAERQWGKMTIAQMLAHCSVSLEQATGKTPFKDESNFMSKTVIKWFVMRSIKKGAFGQNLPTVKSFYVTDEREFTLEKQRLLDNLIDFYAKGQYGHLMPHPGFGAFTNEQWGQLTHLHLDHHLSQFSA